MLVNIRIKHRIHINVHQVLEIFIITACHRVHRLIRIGHGIEKCIQRSFHQFYKWVLSRKIPGTTQDGVLHNMRHACAVLRRRPEAYAEHLVIIIVFYQQDSRPAFLMSEKASLCFDTL